MSDSLSVPAIKICGLTDIEQALAIAAMDVQAIGAIGVAKSARFVDSARRRSLFKALQEKTPNLKRVWVVADPSDGDLREALIGDGTPSSIQLHGAESPSRCAALQQRWPDVEWWKALRPRRAEDLEIMKLYSGTVDALLLDAWSPNQLGGTGHRLPLDWISRRTQFTPWWLAGGINAEWIPKLLREVSPDGLDASSMLEVKPGLKDLGKVQDLVDAVQSLG
ncbi:phosphoribosylanthranilate isomerase [Synechococcus sp. M16CYN]|uniref:phosphoribosylanthranilate isomerase n=1 Tax=Synechococcus sp. M16CYN TaxID=3103139 RepID=UPI003246726B